MKRNGRLSSVPHIRRHMAHAGRQPTSDELARMLHPNPVHVRRTLAGFAITLYDALDGLALFALGHRNEQLSCLVEKAVNAALDQTLAEAEAPTAERLRQVTLAALSEDVNRHHPQSSHGRFHVSESDF